MQNPKTDWLVYILECSDGTWYTGATNNLEKRLAAHQKGTGAKYTRSRLPVVLLASRKGLTKSQALRLEYFIKKQPRDKKLETLECYTNISCSKVIF